MLTKLVQCGLFFNEATNATLFISGHWSTNQVKKMHLTSSLLAKRE